MKLIPEETVSHFWVHRFPLAIMVLLLVVGLFSCANPVAPTGGPIDEEPPQVVRSIPENYSANFEGGQVRIFFDEFVQLRDINNKLLISPPLETMPEIRLRGRSIIMNIEEELRPNTTYNFFFGDAIVDITENNPMLNFQFVVATGDFVDSLSVMGQVLHAYTLAPMEEETYVMLYDEHYDSIPYKEKPVYLSKTNAEGDFWIHNMREGAFKMFALQDLNSNFIYDLPEERIAFLDSLIIPEYLAVEKGGLSPDTVSQKQPEGQQPAIELQQVELPGVAPQEGDLQEPAPEIEPIDTLLDFAQQGSFYSMFMFQEADTLQRVVSATLVRQGLIQILFRVPTDSVWIQEMRQPFEHDWYIPEINPAKDTLRLWLKDVVRDSLFLEVADGSQILDTLELSTVPRRAPQEDDPKLTLRLNTQPSRTLPYFRHLRITADNPVQEWDLSRIELLENDSLPFKLDLRFADNARRVIEVDTLLPPDQNFQLSILPGAFTDIFGLTNDTLQRQFRTTLPENYGTLMLNLDLPHMDNSFILQLLNPQDKVVERKTVTANGTVTFTNLLPGEYRLRMIDDRNENGEWDTGDYLKGLQPEQVYVFTDLIQLRANWEMEVAWEPQPLK